ncbi:MAG TPA: hypothetical protein VGD98_07350 [Ktedonobacteraceae bacterium]
MPVSRHPWMDVFRRSWKEALRFDLSQIMILPALRGSLSIVLPLIIGIATGYTVEGATLAGGAALWTIVNTTSASHGRFSVVSAWRRVPCLAQSSAISPCYQSWS